MDKKKKRIIAIGAVAFLALLFIAFGKKKDVVEDIEYAEVLEGKFVISVDVTGTLEAESSVEIKGPDLMNNRNVRAESLTITDLVTEGTTVKKGDYVATLDRTQFQNTLTGYQEELATLLLDYEAAVLDTAVTLSKARDNIVNQQYVVENTRTTLLNSKYESAGTIRTAELNLKKEENSLNQLLQSYNLTLTQQKINLEKSKSNIRKMEQRIKDYENVLASFYITAPADGMVVYAKDFGGNKIKTGSSIRMMESVVATLPDLSSMLSKVYISEIDVNKVDVGMDVQITVDAFPSKLYTGKITKVAKVGETLANTDTKVFEAYIKMDKVDSQLRPDMTTSNQINIASFDNVVYIPTEAVHTGVDSVTVVYTKSGRKQVVVLGSSNSDNVIIEQGLKKGETIYLTSPANMDKFKLKGKELIEVVRQQNIAKSQQNKNGVKKVEGLAEL